MKDYYLKTSEIFVSTEEYKISTVLGSCVAVCLWDNKLKFGGMIHYLLPECENNISDSPKYGDYAITDLIKQMNNLGSKTTNIQAQIYGGAKILNESLNIGEKNIDIALKKLKEYKIPITNSDTGGTVARKIIFFNAINKIKLINLNKIQ